VKALLLDLDDTLLDYSGGADHCWSQACAAVAVELDQARLLTVLAEARRWFWDDPERQRRERRNMLRAWTQIATLALETYGAPAPEMAAAIAAEFSARRRAVMDLFPETLVCLEALRAHGLPLALVTNGDAVEQRWKIERCALAPYFGTIVIEGEVGAGKPEPIVYHTAMKALGVEPGPDVWMVGDHLEFDVAGPQRLGLHGVWLDRSGGGLPDRTTVRPDRIVRALAEVVQAITGERR
jgi:HAD superfamily hydrolase (TIGR01509 family)